MGKKHLWILSSISDQCVVTVEDVTSFKNKEKNRTLKLSEQVSRIFDQWLYSSSCGRRRQGGGGGTYGGNLFSFLRPARSTYSSKLPCSGAPALIVRRKAHCDTAIVDVLCRQQIKLFQVVSTSEFHEYWWNNLENIFLVPAAFWGASEARTQSRP